MKPKLDYVEIYITNVCNYSCTHCQSLNNFTFKGHQLWDDYREEYSTLSQKIDIETVQIIGGEPTLNPDFEKWVVGIAELWPNAKLQISSNGSQLGKITNTIYQILSKNKGTLWLTCHDISIYNNLLDFSKNFLDDIVADFQPDKDAHDNWKVTYDTVKDSSWPDCNTIEQFANLPEPIKKQFNETHKQNKQLHLRTVPRMLIDKNGVEVKLDWSQTFTSSAVKLHEQRLTMKYDSDPELAHNNCNYKSCHQINKGKLYKCPLVSVLPDFVNQFNLDIDDKNPYVPMSGSDDETVISNFINDLTQPIAQCKFCPVNYTRHNFVGTDKKIKIIPIL
jgi:organic radical activating enzyme